MRQSRKQANTNRYKRMHSAFVGGLLVYCDNCHNPYRDQTYRDPCPHCGATIQEQLAIAKDRQVNSTTEKGEHGYR